MFRRTHKNKPLLLAGVIGLAALVLIVLIFFIGLFVSMKGPSKNYVQNFDANTVASDAKNTENQLTNGIQPLNLTAHGFTALATSYADGCYATNDDSFADWHKVCFGREVAYFSSLRSAGDTKNQMQDILTAIGWDHTLTTGTSENCYGYPLSSIINATLGFTATYQIEDVDTPCASPMPAAMGVSVPISDQSNVTLSSLSHITNADDVLATAKSQGAKSIIAIAAEVPYYNKPLGFFLFQ